MRVEKKRLTTIQQPNHSKNFRVRLRKDELYAIAIAPPASCGLLIQSRADGIKLQQFIAQALAPSALMAHPPQAKVHSSTHPLTRIIAADIMPEHVMRQNHIARPAQNLGR